MNKTPKDFESFDLSPQLLKQIRKFGFKKPTDIQAKTIPAIATGRDVIAMARTGSGKTGSYVIPMIKRLGSHSEVFGPRALIVLPTQQLAKQVALVARKMLPPDDLRLILMTGGDALEDQFEAMKSYPDIIVATPDRLLHVTRNIEEYQKTNILSRVELVIYDEADNLFDQGLGDQVIAIRKFAPNNIQSVLISATMPSQMADFIDAGLQNPIIIRLDVDTKLPAGLKTTFMISTHETKPAALALLARNFVASSELCVVFCATSHHVEFITEFLKKLGLSVGSLYGKMDSKAKDITLNMFREAKINFLVVTDVLARGIDIPEVNVVINFDMPSTPRLFVHRAGRTARAGRTGKCFSIAAVQDLPWVFDVHLFLGKKVINSAIEIDDLYDCTGFIPQTALDLYIENVNKIYGENPDLVYQKDLAYKAYGTYYKHRDSASKISADRSKEWAEDRLLHPIFTDSRLQALQQKIGAANVVETEGIYNMIRTFKPRQTYFESLGQKATMEQQLSIVQKRVADDIKVERHKYRKEIEAIRAEESLKVTAEYKLGSSDKYKSSQMLSYQKSEDTDSEFSALVNKAVARDLVMDIMADDPESMKKQNIKTTWDARKRKYVTRNMDTYSDDVARVKEDRKVKRKVQNESGAWVVEDNSKQNLYKKWAEKTHTAIPTVGEDEDVSAGSKMIHSRQGFGNYKGRYDDAVKKTAADPGLRQVTQIARDRVKRENRRQYMAKMNRSSRCGVKNKGKPTRGRK